MMQQRPPQTQPVVHFAGDTGALIETLRKIQGAYQGWLDRGRRPDFLVGEIVRYRSGCSFGIPYNQPMVCLEILDKIHIVENGDRQTYCDCRIGLEIQGSPFKTFETFLAESFRLEIIPPKLSVVN